MKLLSSPLHRLLWLLTLSCACKLLYVFACTDYSQYLFSDFGGYWERALQRYGGVDRDMFQWAIWPPLAHILLSWAMHVIDWVGLGQWRLEAILVANVMLSTIGVACLYGITLRLTASSRAALLVAALYAFWFPLIYFNAFVMSEHPATAAMLLATWLLIRFPGYLAPLFAAGALLGLAVGMRPALGLMALPCGLFALFAGPFSRVSFKQAAAFTLGFACILGSVVAEVNRISTGQVRSLSANGGLNFYFAQCRTYEVVSRYAGSVYYVIPPATVENPENGSVIVQRPFHDTTFFTKMGWNCVQAQPDLWWRNIVRFGDLFFGPLLPTVPSAVGFRELMPAFRWGALAVACVAPLGLCVARFARRRRIAALLAGLVVVSLVTQFVFNAEHRYLYPLFGFLLALVAWSGLWVYRSWPKGRRETLVYAATLGILVVGACAHATWQQLRSPSLIQAQWYHTRWPFNGAGKPAEGRFVVDTLRFPVGMLLRHGARGELKGAPEEVQYVAIRFDACMKVAERGGIEFVIASDDGFELSIDDRVVASHRASRAYGSTRATAELQAGMHRFSLLYYQETGQLGVAAVWRRVLEGGRLMPGVGLRDVGKSGDGVEFRPPDECGPAR